MRVCNDIRLVRGSSRFAVYDLNGGFCEPASPKEARILSKLATGVHVTPKSIGYSSKTFWALLSSMRKKGWLEKGRPHAISIDSIENNNSPSAIPERLSRVWIETTMACNLKCKHCYVSSGPETDRRKELSLKDWSAVFRDLLDYGVDNITFIGGEPTIRKEVIELGAKLVDQYSPTTSIGVFSNLYKFGRSDEDIAFLKRFNLGVATSLYGTNHTTHDYITNREGSWVRTMESIRHLVKNHIDVFVGYFITSSNERESEVKEWLGNRGITRYDIQAHANVGRAIDVIPIPNKTTNRLPVKIYFSPAGLQNNIKLHNCFSDHLAVTPDGDALGCIMMRDPILGKMPAQRIEDIVAGSQFKKLATLTKKEIDGCADCEYRYACFDCRPAAITNSGNLMQKPDCGYDPRMPLDTEDTAC